MPAKYRASFAAAFLLGSVFAGAARLPADDGGTYRVVDTLRIGGPGNWDYLTVDAEHKLLYVPRTTHTMVIDAAAGKTVADIPGQKGNHGVALVPAVGRGFISDGKDGSVVIFDWKTHQVLGKIKAAEDADAIVYDPASRKVLVSCGDAAVVLPFAADVDPATGRADAPINVEGKPEAIAVDGQGKAYVSLVNKDQVAAIDTRSMTVLQKWPTAPGGSPVGMAIDRDHRRLFVGCRKPQKLIVMSADDGRILADLPIGVGCDGTQFDGIAAFASCRDGSLSIAKETSAGKFEIVQNLKTRPGAKTMGLDPVTHTIYLPTAELSKKLDARRRPIAKPNTFMVLVVRAGGN